MILEGGLCLEEESGIGWFSHFCAFRTKTRHRLDHGRTLPGLKNQREYETTKPTDIGRITERTELGRGCSNSIHQLSHNLQATQNPVLVGDIPSSPARDRRTYYRFLTWHQNTRVSSMSPTHLRPTSWNTEVNTPVQGTQQNPEYSQYDTYIVSLCNSKYLLTPFSWFGITTDLGSLLD